MTRKILAYFLIGSMLLWNIPNVIAQPDGGGASPRWKAPRDTAADLEPLTSDGSVRVVLDTHIVYVYNEATGLWQPIGAGSTTITGTGADTQMAYFTGAQTIEGNDNFLYNRTMNAALGDENILTIDADVNKAAGNYSGIVLNVTETSAPGVFNTLLTLTVGGDPKFLVTNSGIAGCRGLIVAELGGGFGNYQGFLSPGLATTLIYFLPGDYPAVDGYTLSCTTGGVMSWAPSGAVAPGADTNVLFNDGGVTAGAANLLWDKTTDTLTTHDIIPGAGDTYTLGSDTVRWANIYVTGSSIHLGDSGDEVTLLYDTGANELRIDKKVRISGVLDMNGNRIVLTATPGTDFDVTNKVYVDNFVAGLSWQESVIDFWDASAGLPVGPVLDDRYICSVAGTGWVKDNIYQYNGATWDVTVVSAGFAAYVDNLGSAYVHNGTDWVIFASLFSHNALGGLQGGAPAEYYHFTNAEHTELEDWLPAVGLTNNGSIIPAVTDVANLGNVGAYFQNAYANQWNFPDTAGGVGGQILQAGVTVYHNFSSTPGRNLFWGKTAGNFSTSGVDNYGYGESTLAGLTSGDSNIAVGKGTLAADSTGSNNIGVGNTTMSSVTTGSNNTAIGIVSLPNLVIGVNNVALGSSAGAGHTGNNSIFIGTGSGTGVAGLTYATAIGLNAVVSANNSMVLGGTGADAVNVGIGVPDPASFKLQVDGSVGPDQDDLYDLGSPALRWANIYVDEIHSPSIEAPGANSQVIFNDSGVFGASANLTWDDTKLSIGTTAASAYRLSASNNARVMGTTFIDYVRLEDTFTVHAVPGVTARGLYVGESMTGAGYAGNTTNTLTGAYIFAQSAGAAAPVLSTFGFVTGLNVTANALTNNMTYNALQGISCTINATGNPVAVTNAYVYRADVGASSVITTVGSLYGYYVDLASANMVVTNKYGLYIKGVSGAASNYSIYSEGGTNRFFGNIVLDKDATGSPELQLWNVSNRYAYMNYSDSDVLATYSGSNTSGVYAGLAIYGSGADTAQFGLLGTSTVAGLKTTITGVYVGAGLAIGDFTILGSYNNVSSQAVGLKSQSPTSGNGGNVFLTAANGTVAGNGGNVILTAGLGAGAGTAGDVRFYASGDTSDYISLKTVADVPQITTVGSCNLTLAPSSAIIDATASINPTTTATYDLGTDLLRWNNLYLSGASLHLGTSGTDGVFTYDVVNNEVDVAPSIHAGLNSRFGTDDNYWKVETATIVGETYPMIAPYSTSPTWGNVGVFKDYFVIVDVDPLLPPTLAFTDDGTNMGSISYVPSTRIMSFSADSSEFQNNLAVSSGNSDLDEELTLVNTPFLGATAPDGGVRIRIIGARAQGFLGHLDVDMGVIDTIMVDNTQLNNYSNMVFSTLYHDITSERFRITHSGISVTGISYFAGDAFPKTDNTYSLGSGSFRWSNSYVVNQQISNQLTIQPTSGNEAAYGSDLVTNGTFDTDSGWTKGTGWSIPGGAGANHAAGSSSSLSQTLAISTSTYYRISFDVTTTTPGTLTARLGGADSVTLGEENGTITGQIVVVGPTISTVDLQFSASAAWVGSIDNVTCREITLSAALMLLKDPTSITVNEFRANNAGRNNLLIGTNAGACNSLASNNLALGNTALFSLQTGPQNIAIGNATLTNLTVGQYNVAVGYSAMESAVSSSDNVAIGRYALRASKVANRNIAIGEVSLYSNTVGDDNVAIGYQAGYVLTTGDQNIMVGTQAGISTTTGSNNILIGYGIVASSATASNELNIGGAVKGDLSTGDVNLTRNLDVQGQYVSPKKTDTVAVSTWTTDWNEGNVHYVQLGNGAHSAPTFNNPKDGGRYMLILKQPAAGAAGTVTWPATVLWSGGTAPTLTLTNGKVDIIMFVYDGTNSKYYGGFSLAY